ncbi:calcium-binding protein, partial [Erythrobacter sp.]|uniref:calcium-binding protein n=1 Tax=Erythrobacter sp. TaxID=1042 RepID=UPI0025F2C04F
DTPAAPVEETQPPVVDTPAAPVEETQAEEFASIELSGSSNSDVLLGDAGDDVLSGLRGHDRLYGENGDDALLGGRGNDNLYGGVGTDSLFGGKGRDYLDGGEGADILSGGKGSDTFVFGDGDTVLDFKSGVDIIDLTALGVTDAMFEQSVTFSMVGKDTLISVGSQSMTLKNTREIDMDDFSLVEDSGFDSLLSDALAVIEGRSTSLLADADKAQPGAVEGPAVLADLVPYPMLDGGMLPVRPLEDDFITPMM